MKRALLILASFCALLPAARAEETSIVRQVAAGSTEFALELYSQVRTNKGNIVISPFSVQLALAMTYAGARGNTEQEMAKVLHVPVDQQQYHAAMERLQRHIGAVIIRGGWLDIRLVNALFAQEGRDLLPDVLRFITERYGAECLTADFESSPDKAVRNINVWAANHTIGRIDELLDENSVNEQTRLVLGSAIYFKGAWAGKFDPELSSPSVFTPQAGEVVSVHMMCTRQKFRYGEFLCGASTHVQVLELPYSGEDLSMIILLPRDAKDGAAGVESTLNALALNKWIQQLEPREVEVFLPRFEIDTSCSLLGALSAMGMKDSLARGKADFSGLNGTNDLFIGAVRHLAGIRVNESGAEERAATAVAAVESGAEKPETQAVFRADHPFLFFIRDSLSGVILFMGRIEDLGHEARRDKYLAWVEMYSSWVDMDGTYPVYGLSYGRLLGLLDVLRKDLPNGCAVSSIRVGKYSATVGTVITRGSEAARGDDLILKADSLFNWTFSKRVETQDKAATAGLPVSELRALAQAIGDQPVLGITVVSDKKVEVETGSMTGPLAGGGRHLVFEKKGGKWEETGCGGWIS